ncbi:MAG: 4-phosphopantoate--beta-alanine ligase [Thermoplasmatota archaeon]
MSSIPKNHPRYLSLMTREKIVKAMNEGIVHQTGLIAHGRGEAFDYLLGEKTIDVASLAAKTAAAQLLIAKKPVLSINGNVAALAAKESISLALSIPAKIEVNLFHRNPQRIKSIINKLYDAGAEKVYGAHADKKIPDLSHDRSLCEYEGIYSADTVVVSLEDGDRCQALVTMGKTVIAIDLNPLSRTAINAHITIVDNVVRAVPTIEEWVKKLRDKSPAELQMIINRWDNKVNLAEVLKFMSKRLNSMFEYG